MTDPQPPKTWGPKSERVAQWSGAILALSYPILALSTGSRAAVQLLRGGEGIVRLGPTTTALAAVLYLAASIGFVLRRRWAWMLSVTVLSFELVMAVAVGTLSVVASDRVGSSVWRLYGIDYGFFPLFQPILGLIWLLWPLTRIRYGLRGAIEPAT